MPTYIGLFKLTDKGPRVIKEALPRIEEAEKAYESMGGKLIDSYTVEGEYDYVAIGEAPSDSVQMSFSQALESEEFVRPTILKVKRKLKEKKPDKVVTWTAGTYLLVHTLFLSGLAIITWLADKSLIDSIPLISVSEDKLYLFKQLIISACCAGLGGGVFMTKRFFMGYAEGVEDEKGRKVPLSAKEIPRLILLPISSVIIGPLSLCLLKGGIALGGLPRDGEIAMFTVVATSFILGLTYYDTLHAFCGISKRIFWERLGTKKPGKEDIST